MFATVDVSFDLTMIAFQRFVAMIPGGQGSDDFGRLADDYGLARISSVAC